MSVFGRKPTPRVDPDSPHVFEEVPILPMINSTVGGEPGMTGYTMPPTPMSNAPQCGVCHRPRDHRLHLAAESHESGRWGL